MCPCARVLACALFFGLHLTAGLPCLAAGNETSGERGRDPEWTDMTGMLPADAGDSQGVSWIDYDGDGDLDLYITSFDMANVLYRNAYSGTAFVWMQGHELSDLGNGSEATWGDFENDGDLDLYLVNYTQPDPGNSQSNALFRNLGAGVFDRETDGPLGDANPGFAGDWIDYDNDGDLDLFLLNEHYAGGDLNRLLRNDNGSFTDVTPLCLQRGWCVDAAWADYDNDGDMDFFSACQGLFENDGQGGFIDHWWWYPGDGPGGAAAWGDYDNDGFMDLFLSKGYLFRNDGGSGNFDDETHGDLGSCQGSPSCHDNPLWGDYDNDGDLDLCLMGSFFDGMRLFRNEGPGGFVDVTASPLSDCFAMNGAWGDYDEDGDLDLFVVQPIYSGPVPPPQDDDHLFRNEI